MFDRCLYFNTTALARTVERQWARAFSSFGLTAPQGFMLRAVLEVPGILQRDLAATLVVARPTATRLLDALVSKAWVARRASPTDGREQVLFPTAKAIAQHEALNEASRRVTRRISKSVGAEAFDGVVDRMSRIRRALDPE